MGRISKNLYQMHSWSQKCLSLLDLRTYQLKQELNPFRTNRLANKTSAFTEHSLPPGNLKICLLLVMDDCASEVAVFWACVWQLKGFWTLCCGPFVYGAHYILHYKSTRFPSLFWYELGLMDVSRYNVDLGISPSIFFLFSYLSCSFKHFVLEFFYSIHNLV